MQTRDFLIFRLAGLLSAFGDITVGERRSSWDAPSKSAVLGFIAACLGITREDDKAHEALEKHLGFAVRVDNPGRPLRDYHTAQAAKEASRNKRKKDGLSLNTRKDELECDDLSTVLSERIYRLEAESTIALWVKPDQQEDLERLKAALISPLFLPYLGRKSCPLSFPARPFIINAENLISAFNHYDGKVYEEKIQLAKWGNYRKSSSPDLPIWFECGAGLIEEESPSTPLRQRRDSIRHRALWQFTERSEGYLKYPVHFDFLDKEATI